MFGITVLKGDQTYLMGPADRNPDRLAHAGVETTGSGALLIGFEDLFGGGDRDYDDTVFRFTGNLLPGGTVGSPTPPGVDGPAPATPPPTSPPPTSEPGALTLRLGEARSLLPKVLRKRYGRRYTSRRGVLRRSCRRLSGAQVGCRVRWRTRRHRYAGRATMWRDGAEPGSILFTTSIRRTRRAA